jgi:uncharacterized protein (DUF952 family)
VTQPEIFHITEQEQWVGAQSAGGYMQSTRGATVDDVGFIHCSFRHQIATVARLVYGDHDGPLVVLRIDPARVGSEIKVEDGFPHIYGPLPVAAVIDVEPFTQTH